MLVAGGFQGRPSNQIREEVNRVLAPHRERTNKPRWDGVIDSWDDEESAWIYETSPTKDSQSPRYTQATQISPFSLPSNVVKDRLAILREELCENSTSDIEHILLQIGIPLPGGSTLSRVGKSWALDGEILPGDVPFVHIIRTLTGGARTQERFEEINWGELLYGICSITSPSVKRRTHYNFRGREMNEFLRNENQRAEFRGREGFQIWMERFVQNREVQRDERGQIDPEVFPNINQRANRFDVDLGAINQLNHHFGPGLRNLGKGQKNLRVHKGRLQLRTIREGNWIWSQIPAWPKLWGLLTSWALSPPLSKENQRLSALQWCWHHPYGELMPSESERRSLLLLRDICESDERITPPDGDLSAIRVQGTSGLFYLVSSGPGAHGARFKVMGAVNQEDYDAGRTTPLCIHEAPNFSQLPVGDVISSAVLTLLDDKTSSLKLEPLRQFIEMNSGRRGVVPAPAGYRPGWLRQQQLLFIQPDRYGEGRWLNIFPQIFRVLTHLPIDSVIQFPDVTPNEVTIDDTRISWMARDEEELELAKGLARIVGFVPVNHADIAGYQPFRRRAVRIENVRRDLVELLGPIERRHGRPGEPPWWNLFPNPIGPADLIDRLPHRFNHAIE